MDELFGTPVSDIATVLAIAFAIMVGGTAVRSHPR